MKKFLFLLISLILVISCSNNIGNDNVNLTKYSVKKSISNSTVDLKDAKYLAITLSESTTGAKGIGNKRPHLHKVKENGESEEVVIQEDYSDYKISVDSLDLEIYKMTTIENYSLVSYISSKIRDELEATPITYSLGEQQFTLYVYPEFQNIIQYPWDSKLDRTYFQIYDITKGVPINFNTKGYFNNDYIKSYLINNATGKIYSLEQFECISIENGIITNNNGVYYNVEFDEDDNLILSEIISNKDININAVFTDKDNWRYVFNDVVKSVNTEKKIVYLNDGTYRFDSNRTLIKFDNLTESPKYIFKDGVPVEVTESDILFGIQYITGNEEYWYSSNNSAIALINGKLTNGGHTFGGNGSIAGRVLATDILNGGSCYLYEDDSPTKSAFWFDDECKYLCKYEKGSSLEYAQVDWINADYCHWSDLTESKLIKPEWNTLLDNTTSRLTCYRMNGTQIERVRNAFKCVGLSGTEYYILKENENKTGLDVELLSQVITPTKYFVIQPIK